MLVRGAISGLCSGIVMGLLLKFLEMLSSKKVYVLLLNVDFIPGFKNKEFSEFTEFTFHLVIAIIIGIVFAWLVNLLKIHSMQHKMILSFLLTFPTILLYFPLTILAVKATPEVNDIHALALWSLGHAAFAVLLPLFYTYPKIKQRG